MRSRSGSRRAPAATECQGLSQGLRALVSQREWHPFVHIPKARTGQGAVWVRPAQGHSFLSGQGKFIASRPAFSGLQPAEDLVPRRIYLA